MNINNIQGRISSLKNSLLSKTALFVVAAAFLVGGFFVVNTAHAALAPSPSPCDVSGTPFLTYTQNISNDPDSSNFNGGTWAMDTFTENVSVWVASDGTYCANANTTNGTFVTVGSTSPEKGAPMVSGITGSFSGGENYTLPSALTLNPAYSTTTVSHITLPANDCGGVTGSACLSGAFSKWVSDAFTNANPSGSSYVNTYWLQYVTNNNGTWTNADPSSGGDAGDISGSLSTVYVDPSGSDTNNGLSTAPFKTIQAAVNAVASNGTVNVAAGNYTENITISKAVTLEGSTGTDITGSFTVASDGVKIDGFDITNPGGSFGIVGTDFSNLTFTHNNIHDIGTSLTSGSAEAIAVISGSKDVSNIDVENNTISNIGNTSMTHAGSAGSSAKGVYLGNSSGTNTFSNVKVANNRMTGIYASTAAWIGSPNYGGGAGAYGILVNHQINDLTVSGNTIGTLEGLWAHAIGLEADTQNTTVTGNVISGLTDHKNNTDSVAVRFESNPSASTVTGSGNTFDSNSLVLGNSSAVVDQSVVTESGNTYPETLLNGKYYYAGVNAFSTIQDAVNTVASGGTINVAAGTYDSFSVIGKSNITITGSGAAQTQIIPTTLVDSHTTHKYTSDMMVSVFVKGSTGITIQGMTVQDNGKAPSLGGPDALIFWDASSGTLKDNNITGTYAINGSQTGQGVAVDAGSGETVNLAVTDCVISGFQKNGIEAIDGNGAESGTTDTITLTVTGGSVTGAGPTSAIAQNGIVVWSRGGGTVTGSVTGTTISKFYYSGNDTAAGVLAYGGGNVTTVTQSTFADNQFNISTTAGSPAINAVKNYWGSVSGPADGSLDGTVSFSPWFSDAGMTALSTTPTSSDETLPAGSTGVTVAIPANTTVSGNSTWDGTISAPSATTVNLSIPGYTTSTTSAIAVGSSDSDLTFDKAVELIFPNQAGQHVGWYNHAGTFTEITTICADDTQATNDSLPSGTSCKINASPDLHVWTKHFSTFVTYSQNQIVYGGGGAQISSGGSSGGSTYVAPVVVTTPVVTTPAPVIGQVLGASTGPVTIPGCDNRTTGFSVTTGQSCVGNTPSGKVLGAQSYHFTLILRNGSKGDEVMELQKFLNNAGYNSGATDGIFGPKTKAAVIKFETENKLKGDGVVGPKVRALLNA